MFKVIISLFLDCARRDLGGWIDRIIQVLNQIAEYSLCRSCPFCLLSMLTNVVAKHLQPTYLVGRTIQCPHPPPELQVFSIITISTHLIPATEEWEAALHDDRVGLECEICMNHCGMPSVICCEISGGFLINREDEICKSRRRWFEEKVWVLWSRGLKMLFCKPFRGKFYSRRPLYRVLSYHPNT